MKYHGVTQFDVSTGAFQKAPAKAPSYTSVFGKAICELAEKDPRIVAITAAMCEGMRPVAAIYSTFLQRAYDQLAHDICLMHLPVTLALDRAGIVGADGPTHHGLYDLVYLSALPGMVVMAPKDENELRHMLYTALSIDGPAAVRYPRGNGIGVPLDPEFKQLEIGKAEILHDGGDIAILALGTMVYPCLEAAQRLESMGIRATVINARFMKPLDEELFCILASEKQFLVTAEEGTEAGGFGAQVAAMLHDRRVPTSILRIAVPDRIIPHGAPNLLHAKYGLDVEGIVEKIKNYAEEFPIRFETRYRSAHQS